MSEDILEKLKPGLRIVPDPSCDVMVQVDAVHRGEKSMAWFPYRYNMDGLVAWDDVDYRLISAVEEYHTAGEVVGNVVCRQNEIDSFLKELGSLEEQSFTSFIGQKLEYSFPWKPTMPGSRVVSVYLGDAVVHDEIAPPEMAQIVAGHLRYRFPHATHVLVETAEVALNNRIARYNSMDRRLFLK